MEGVEEKEEKRQREAKAWLEQRDRNNLPPPRPSTSAAPASPIVHHCCHLAPPQSPTNPLCCPLTPKVFCSPSLDTIATHNHHHLLMPVLSLSPVLNEGERCSGVNGKVEKPVGEAGWLLHGKWNSKQDGRWRAQNGARQSNGKLG